MDGGRISTSSGKEQRSFRNLLKAIENKNHQNFEKLLKGHGGTKEFVNRYLDKGRKPIHVACKSRNTVALKALVGHGADINAKCSKGYTALHYACRAACISCIVFLVEMGADLREANNPTNESPLDSIPPKEQARLGSLLRTATENREKHVSESKRISNSAFLKEFVICDEIPYLCNDQIEVDQSIELARGARLNFCHGTFNGMNVMVKYEDKEKDALVLRDEVIALRKLGNHVNFVQILGVTCVNEEFNIIFEAPGYAFLHRVLFQTKAPIKKVEVLTICRDIANALRYIHGKGYLHCAVASFSVVLGRDLDAKLCNFNYVQEKDRAKSVSQHSELYPYMSVEQRQGHRCSIANDVFGMGITMTEMITQERAYEILSKSKGKTLRDVYMQILRQIERSGGSSATLKNLVSYCIHWVPKERPTAEMVYEWTDALLQDGQEVDLKLGRRRQLVELQLD